MGLWPGATFSFHFPAVPQKPAGIHNDTLIYISAFVSTDALDHVSFYILYLTQSLLEVLQILFITYLL